LPVSFKWLFLLSFIACLTHPAMDWLNVYGIRLLEPFSHRWFYGDTLFIIDIWLWLGLGFATWFSLRREKKGGEWRRPARIGLMAMLGYIFVNFVFSRLDELTFDDAPIAISSPVPIFFWERELISGHGDGHWWVEHRELGVFDLRPEDYPDIIAAVPEAEPFLFWSRTPYVARDADGRFYLRDARFPGRGGFQVELPEAVCKPKLPPPDFSRLETETS